MTLTQAVSSVLGQYAGFRGRARRAEFWWWNLFGLLLGLTIAVAELSLGVSGENGGPVSTLVALALLVPNLSVSVRRLHDTSRSGWWLLLAPVPFVGLVVLMVFFLAPSTAGPNAHGPDPRLAADPQSLDPARGRGDVLDTGPTTTTVATSTAGEEPAGAGWTPPGWDLPSADEPRAGRGAQDHGSHDDPDADRPQP